MGEEDEEPKQKMIVRVARVRKRLGEKKKKKNDLLVGYLRVGFQLSLCIINAQWLLTTINVQLLLTKINAPRLLTIIIALLEWVVFQTLGIWFCS